MTKQVNAHGASTPTHVLQEMGWTESNPSTVVELSISCRYDYIDNPWQGPVILTYSFNYLSDTR